MDTLNEGLYMTIFVYVDTIDTRHIIIYIHIYIYIVHCHVRFPGPLTADQYAPDRRLSHPALPGGVWPPRNEQRVRVRPDAGAVQDLQLGDAQGEHL